MHERFGFTALPFPFHDIPAQSSPLRTLDFLTPMHALLEQAQGLSALCYAASQSDDVAEQELTQGLFILKEYLGSAVALFARWQRAVHPGPGNEEEEAD